MKENYAASTEVATVLRQASSIDTFFKTQPAGTRGALDQELPSTAEADRLFGRATLLQKVVTERKLVAAGGMWTKLAPQVRDLAGMYRVGW
jgi:hypothetical protein